ncbi:MAG: hypothetical protein KDA28_01750, partial [Phycisphaerales bacterium]|nr:hypothetical protein [Phycisphaerales bacterium]
TLDCDNNGIDDAMDIAGGAPDLNQNGILDTCEVRLYVDPSNPSPDDGGTWSGSLPDLGDATRLANLRCADVGSIWVADGVQRPDGGTGDPWMRYSLRSGLVIVGGFQGVSHPSGGETSIDERLSDQYPTILSGDIGVPGDPSDNTYSIVDAIDTDAFAVLDGVTVRDGASFADASGMYIVRSAPDVRHVTFLDNHAIGAGGAVAVFESSAPTFAWCHFEGNRADWIGGAIAAADSTLRIDNSVFESNHAMSYAGAVDAWNSTVTLSNVVLHLNDAGIDGGAMSAAGGSNVTLANVTAHANVASNLGGGVTINDTTLDVTNSILWDNIDATGQGQSSQIFRYTGLVTLDHSCLEGLDGSLGGVGNIGDDPGLDLSSRPGSGSPVIDAGRNAGVPLDLLDVDGDGDRTERIPLDGSREARFLDAPGTPDTGVSGAGHDEVVDIGAFEVRECRADVNGDGVLDIFDVLVFLGHFDAGAGGADWNADTTIDIFDVLAFLGDFDGGC